MQRQITCTNHHLKASDLTITFNAAPALNAALAPVSTASSPHCRSHASCSTLSLLHLCPPVRVACSVKTGVITYGVQLRINITQYCGPVLAMSHADALFA